MTAAVPNGCITVGHIRPTFPFLDEDIEVRPQELKMAASLISSMTVDFDPSQYRDGYREALEKLVGAKIQRRDVLRPEEPAGGPGSPGSLAEVLRASLAAAGDRKAS